MCRAFAVCEPLHGWLALMFSSARPAYASGYSRSFWSPVIVICLLACLLAMLALKLSWQPVRRPLCYSTFLPSNEALALPSSEPCCNNETTKIVLTRTSAATVPLLLPPRSFS